jgi:flotillin
MTEHQAKVMAEAMGKADIKIVGGDGQFFDRFVKAVSLGNQIDGVIGSSEVVQNVLGDRLNGNGPLLIEDVKDMVRAAAGSSEAVKNLTIAAVLGQLLAGADPAKRGALQALLEKARALGVDQHKVS